MSYKKTFHDRISYSGTVTYSYPASEHGGTGTAHYSGSVPVDIGIEVDTDPFDEGVDHASQSLGTVAGLLSAAEVAQVAAIKASGERIAQTATRGFFALLSSDISAQISEFGSSLKASAGLMMEQALAIDRIHQQMEQDYHAIKARYARVFSDLDSELKRRIRELDAHCFKLKERCVDAVVNRPYVDNAAGVLVGTVDQHATAGKMQSARTKEHASEALDSLSDVCDQIRDYRGAVSGLLDTTAGDSVECVPVVYALQRDLDTGFDRIIVHGSGAGASDEVRKGVISFAARVPDGSWTALAPSDAAAVDGQFYGLVQRYGEGVTGAAPGGAHNDRVRQMIVSLYQHNAPKTVYVR